MREAASLSRRAFAAALPIATLAGTSALAAAEAARTSPSDPVLEQIEKHRALRKSIGQTSGRDDDPAYLTACDAEEIAIQALGDMMPTTIAGATAQLAYMAEVEGDFADHQSPLLRTVLTVAKALAGGLPA